MNLENIIKNSIIGETFNDLNKPKDLIVNSSDDIGIQIFVDTSKHDINDQNKVTSLSENELIAFNDKFKTNYSNVRYTIFSYKLNENFKIVEFTM